MIERRAEVKRDGKGKEKGKDAHTGPFVLIDRAAVSAQHMCTDSGQQGHRWTSAIINLIDQLIIAVWRGAAMGCIEMRITSVEGGNE